MEFINDIFTTLPLPFALAATGFVFVVIYALLGISIYIAQKWWCYATITKTEIPWNYLILGKISLHKIKYKPRLFFAYEAISPFGKKKDIEELTFEVATVIFCIPTVVYLGVNFWEVTLILGVLVLLTKLSRLVITVKRKLDKHMVDPQAHQDK